MVNQKGILYGIGVGPGDPELLTLKAHRLINECDILAYPAPEVGEGLALEIVRPLLKNQTEFLPLRLPIAISPFPAQQAYDQAAKLLEVPLDIGKTVAVICEGDPFFYGSFMYLFERLSERFMTEIIPGVSSPMAGAAVLKTPLVSRNEVLTILPGPLEETDLEQRLLNTDAAVIMKVGRHLTKIRRVLRHLRLEHCAHYVEHATMPNQQIIPIENLEAQNVPYFSMILVRKIKGHLMSGVV
ncbi:MAG: precorrin-2 C(20)-methyltransferase [Proteobacteria bacterium]|nr:precorrin-2 C(20)-methyltransferase [Pseudomonadota bacterium]